jgi:hypothetical protein
MEKSTKENQDSQENLGISAHLIMKSSATVERKVVWKQKLRLSITPYSAGTNKERRKFYFIRTD